MNTDLAAAWTALAASSPKSGDLRLSAFGPAVPAGRLCVGRDSPGRLHLLVPVPSGTPVRGDRRSRGVTIERNELVVDGSRTTFVDVVCHDQTLSDLFERLTAEMVERVLSADGSVMVACHSVLGRWRELLDRRGGGLGEEAVAGLFGELCVLKTVVERDPARRVGCWIGPTGAVHDFVSPSASIEVKSSKRREGRFAEIHGVEQLDGGAARPLYLVHAAVRDDPDGETISGIVNELKVSGVDPIALDQLLAEAGWAASDPPADEPRLAVTDLRMYLVDDAFPKIIPSSFTGGELPPGVLRLRYEVDLTGGVPPHLSITEMERVFETIARDP